MRTLPHTFAEVDRLNDKVLSFKATEGDIKIFTSEHPELAVYPMR